MRGKRGISAIVATVLVILVTVAAISIVWLVIIPVVKQGATFDDVDTRLDVVKSTGYTFYDPLTDILYVQVKRGSDDNEMIGMDIVLVIEGNSETFTYNKTYVPGPNQAKTIVIEAGPIKPEEIRVNPVVNDGGTIKRSSIVSDSVPGESEATELMDVTPVSERDLSIPAECESNDDCESGDVCYEESCVTPAPCPTENSSVCVGTNVTFNQGYGVSCVVNGSKTGTCIAASDRDCGTTITQPDCTTGCETTGESCDGDLICNTGIGKCEGEIFQEDADSYYCEVGNCSAGIDRDWESHIGYWFANLSENTLYLNYSKPNNALSSSYWKVGTMQVNEQGRDNETVEIPSNCWTESSPLLQFKVNVQDIGSWQSESYFSCLGDGAWQEVGSASSWWTFSEEAMVWDIG